MHAVYDPNNDQVVIFDEGGGELARMQLDDAASFGRDVIAASNKEVTGSEVFLGEGE